MSTTEGILDSLEDGNFDHPDGVYLEPGQRAESYNADPRFVGTYDLTESVLVNIRDLSGVKSVAYKATDDKKRRVEKIARDFEEIANDLQPGPYREAVLIAGDGAFDTLNGQIDRNDFDCDAPDGYPVDEEGKPLAFEHPIKAKAGLVSTIWVERKSKAVIDNEANRILLDRGTTGRSDIQTNRHIEIPRDSFFQYIRDEL